MKSLDRYFVLPALLFASGALLQQCAPAQTADKPPTQPSPASAPAAPQANAPAAAPATEPPAATAPTTATAPKVVDPEAIGDSLAARQRYQAAIASYSKVTTMTAGLWNKMGIAYQMMLNFNQALICYQKSIRLNPTDPQVYNNLATVYGSMKNYGAADRMYRKAIKIDPKSALVLKNYGTNLMTEHKYSKGWEAYQKALAIDPTIFAPHEGPTVQNAASVGDRGAMNYYMALGCVRAGYTDCALEYLRSAINEGYTNPKKIAADDAFASLRGNAAFQQMLAEQQRTQ